MKKVILYIVITLTLSFTIGFIVNSKTYGTNHEVKEEIVIRGYYLVKYKVRLCL